MVKKEIISVQKMQMLNYPSSKMKLIHIIRKKSDTTE